MFNIQVSSVEAGAAEPSGRWILGGVRPFIDFVYPRTGCAPSLSPRTPRSESSDFSLSVNLRALCERNLLPLTEIHSAAEPQPKESGPKGTAKQENRKHRKTGSSGKFRDQDPAPIHYSRQGRRGRKEVCAVPKTSWRTWRSLREEFSGFEFMGGSRRKRLE